MDKDKAGTVMTLNKECYFLKYPSQNELLSVTNGSMSHTYSRYINGKVKKVTEVKYLRTYAEQDIISSTTSRSYARILTGPYKGKKVNFNNIYKDPQDLFDYMNQ